MPPKAKLDRSRSRGAALNNSNISNTSVQSGSLLQKEDEMEVNAKFLEISKEILNGGMEASAVTNLQKVTLLNLAKSKPHIFLTAFKSFIERLLILEADDALLRNFFRLVHKLFDDLYKNKAFKDRKHTLSD
jgi:hypothetical protein